MSVRPGHCPSCDAPFDADRHFPMVSVVCGHSLCEQCAARHSIHPNPTPTTSPTNPETASSSSSSDDDDDDDDDDDEQQSAPPPCPVCNTILAGFVKNFEAVAALNLSPSLTQPTATSAPIRPAPDLSAVVHRDLVIRRADIHFTRSPHSEVGRGASAVVYRGSYAAQPVAVKCIRTMSESFTAEDRLRRELRNASRLQHPHIVQFRGAAWDHEAGPSSPRNILLVTELMAGGNLRENLNRLLSQGACLPVEHFVRIALHVARGILYLHDEGLAHRDIKSANILLTQPLSPQARRFPPSVFAKIADFGLSKYIDKATGGGTVMQSLMEPGRLEATYSYLAPEAFGGDKSNVIRRDDSDDDDEPRYDEMAKKRDIYALGVLFWEILTCKIPWAGVSLPDVYVRVCVRSDRPAPALDDATVSKSVRRLVERCWAQNPHKRPSAKSIVAKLEKLAARFGVDVSETSQMHAKPVSNGAAVPLKQGVGAAPPDAPNESDPMPRVAQRPDMHAEPLHEHVADLPPQHPAYLQKRTPSEPHIAYQKMPSASTVYTAPDGAKTHSTGFEGNEDRVVEEFPAPFDDSGWVDDGDATSRSHGQRSLQSNPGASSSAKGNDPNDASSSIKRRLSRSRHSAHDHPEQNHNRFSVAQGLQPSATSSVTPSPSPVSPAPKAKATAVAATAAAIAAAKDRERKRDDVRATRAQVNRISRAPPPAGEASFQSLPGVEPWQKVAAKPNDMRPVFYDNSDEEANDFDPVRAAAEEALAESNNQIAIQAQQTNTRASTSAANAVSSAAVSAAAQPRPQSQAVRSASVNRLSRPKSPVVRRPISPMVARPFSTAQNQTRGAGEDELAVRPTASLPRNSDASIPKKTKSSGSRGRLGRTMSASASQAPNVNRASTPVFKSSSAAPVASTTAEPTGKRAFIRRMRSNEMNRRMARSSSSADVENKRRQHAAVKTTRSYASESVQQTENENNYTVVQIGSGPKEEFTRTVDSLGKEGLMQLFAERMAPLRLAALAHAALISDKHSAEEEIIRNSCAILHKLTVLENQTTQKNSVHSLSSKEQLSIRKYLTAMHGVDALLSVLHPPEKRHPTTLSYCFLALGNLNAWDLEARRQFRNSHGVLHIAEVMVVHRNNNGVQEKGSYALACVGGAYPSKSKYIFEQAGALDVVIQALSAVQGENPNDAVTKQACAALGAMCSSCPSNAQYSAKKDALQYLIAAFERFRRASRVDGGKRGEMRLVCKAFMDLLCHPENRKLAGSIGGSTMIIRAMRIFRLDSDFIEKGLTMLSDFCTYRSNGMQIVQAGGVDDIVAAMERFRLSVTMQKEGSRVLTLLMKATGDQARRRMVHAGGAEAIVFALERFGAIPDNNVPVVVETCRALHMLFLMENTAEGEILGKRMKKVRCDKAIKTATATHKTKPQVQEKAREALKQLGHLKGGGGIFGRMRSGAKRR